MTQSCYVFVDESHLQEKNAVLVTSLILTEETFQKWSNEVVQLLGRRELPEIHFKELSRQSPVKRELINKYLGLLKSGYHDDGYFVNFTLADKEKLESDFGSGPTRARNIEKRFSRICMASTLNRFNRRYRGIKIKEIIIDRGGRTDDLYFREHSIRKLTSKTRAKLPKKIRFIDSDPRNHQSAPDKQYCIFLNMVDLYTGALRNLIADQKATNVQKKKVTTSALEFIDRCSRRYYRYGRVAIYPKLRRTSVFTQSLILGGKRRQHKHKYSHDLQLILKYAIKPYDTLEATQK